MYKIKNMTDLYILDYFDDLKVVRFGSALMEENGYLYYCDGKTVLNRLDSGEEVCIWPNATYNAFSVGISSYVLKQYV